MSNWNILDEKEYPDDYKPTVCFDKFASNFSIIVSAVLRSKQECDNLNIKSSICDSYITVYFDTVLLVFSSIDCNLIWSNYFESDINNLIILKEKHKLILFLRTGKILLLHLKSKYVQDINFNISQENFSLSFLIEEDNETILLVNEKYNIYPSYLLKLFDEDNNDVISCTISPIYYQNISFKSMISIKLKQMKRKKIHNSLLYVRPSPNRNIELFCPVTNQCYIIGESLFIDDIIPFEDNNKVLMLSLPQNDLYNLSIVDFHTLKKEFNIDIGQHHFIIGGINDFALYSEIKNGKLYIFMIKENSPLSQLEILISLRNYEDAELFAKMHNLSPTAVLELKAKFVLNNLKKIYSSDMLQEFQDILAQCDNIDFIVNCCCEGVESNVELSGLLEFSKKRLYNTNNLILNKQIDELLWRVEAFKLINYEDCNSLFSWSEFVNGNAVYLCKKYIINDLIDCAIIVWMKSYNLIRGTLKSRDAADLLCSISLDTKLNSLLRWLEYFIPCVNSIMPYGADLIITWAKDRISVLENSIHWPEVGIQFAEKFSKLMFDSKGLISFIPPSAENVFYLIKCMKQIQILKKKYNIIILLRDFTTLHVNELAKLILRKAFTEDLQHLLKDFLYDFIIKHNLNHDALLRDYIEELITMSSIDEMRINVLINSIYNADEKYQCVINFLKIAAVPWSDVIEKISSDAIASKHALVPKIQLEVIHADLKTILLKYKCQDSSCDDIEYLIEFIIHEDRPEMMTDIEKVTTVYNSLKKEAYLMCIQSHLEKSNIFKALSIFNNMQNCFKLNCVNILSLILESQLSSRIINKQLEKNYIDFIQSTSMANKNITFYNNIYFLKNRYEVYISFNEYNLKENRLLFLNKWCDEKSKIKNNLHEYIKNLILDSLQIGKLLMISKAESLLVLLNCFSGDTLISIANTIMSMQSCFLEINIKSIDLIVKLFPIIRMDVSHLDILIKFLLEVMENCEVEYISYCIDVCSWLISIYYTHNNVREALNMWKLSSFYNPHIVTSISSTWQAIFQRNSLSEYKKKNVNVCLCVVREQCYDGSSCLINQLKKYQLEQNDLYFLRILSYCYNWHVEKDLEIPMWFSDLSDLMVVNLLSKMISSEEFDYLLTSMLIFLYSNSGELLNEILTKSIQPKKYNFAQHILKCKDMYLHLNAPFTQANIIKSQSIIEAKLDSYGITPKFQQDDSYNLSYLLESLINIKNCDFTILEEFCSIAKINLNQSLIYILFSLLKHWTDNYMFMYDNFGNCKIYADDVTNNNMMKYCLSIVRKISNKDLLVNDLTSLFKNGEINIQNLGIVNLNPYCYEVYIFILHMLKSITGKEIYLREYLLLKFLQNYQRVNKPKQTELEEFSMKESFPKIGFYRLPFQMIMCNDFWNNLKSEVTLSTYKKWLPVAGLLPLNIDIQVGRDLICSNAVKQSMTVEKLNNEGTNIKWTLHMKNDRLLKEAHECVQHITNLEWAGACFYYVYQGSALGADQVAAVDLCYQFAEHWAKVEPNNNVMKKMRIKHLLTSTAHILRKINLVEDKLLSLCDNPHRLIESLYNHERILNNYECLDINNAVDEIAEKHNLNAGTIRMSILEKILNVNNIQSKDLSNVFNKSTSLVDGTLSKELVMKACYILKGTNRMMASLYLSQVGLGNNEAVDNYNTNIRALQCLLSLADCEIIEKVTDRKVSDLWSKLWELYFINGLIIIGVEYLVKVFHEDKFQVIQQIWDSKNHNHLTISLVIKMIIIYNIQIKDDLLDDIIKIIMKFDMIFEVQTFLSSIRLLYTSNYINMWNHILVTPFKRLDTPLIGHQKDECYEAVRLLPLCPVISHIDLTYILSNCLHSNVADLAVTVLPHMSLKTRKQAIEKIGKVKKSILQELKTMKSKGIITTNMIMSVLKTELTR